MRPFTGFQLKPRASTGFPATKVEINLLAGSLINLPVSIETIATFGGSKKEPPGVPSRKFEFWAEHPVSGAVTGVVHGPHASLGFKGSQGARLGGWGTRTRHHSI